MPLLFGEKFLTRRRLALIASVITAFYVFLTGLAGTVLWPQTTLTPELVGAVAVSRKGTVIIDHSHTRLLFLNAERQVVKVLNLDSVDVPMDLAHHVAVVDDKVYVLGLRMRQQGVTIGGETLLCYNLAGKLVEEIYHEDYPDGEYVQIPRFTNLCATADRLSLIKLLPGAVERLQFEAGAAEPRHTLISPELEEILRLAYYVEDNGDMLLLSTAGWYYYYNHETGGFARLDHATGQADILSILRLPAVAAKQIFKDNFIPHPSMLAVDQLRGQSFHVNSAHELQAYYLADGTDLPVKDIPLAPAYLVEIGLFWLAAGYLVVLSCVGVGKLLRYLWREENSRRLLVTGLVMVVLAAGIAGYYTKSSHQVINESYDYFIQVQYRQLKMLLERDFSAVLAKVDKAGGLEYLQDRANRVEIHELQEFLVNYIRACGDGTGYYTELNVLGKDGNYYSLADSSRREITGDVIYRKEDIPPPEAFLPEAVVQDINYYGEVRFVPGFFFGEQQSPVIQFEIGYMVPHLAQKQQQFALTAFFNLLAVMMGLYGLYRIGRAGHTAFSRYRQEKQAGRAAAPLQLYPLVGFLYMQSIKMDCLIFVFIVATICDGSFTEVARYSALVLFCINIGMLAGNLLQPHLQRRLPALQLGCGLALLSMVPFMGMIVAATTKNMNLLLAMNFLKGLLQFGMLHSWIRSLPQLIPAEERKTLFYDGQLVFDISIMLALLFGGYLYNWFGYVFVYGYSMVAMLILFGLLLSCFRSINRLTVPVAEAAGAVRALRTDWKVFGKPELLVYAFGLHIIYVLVFCFFTYMYPTVAADTGLSASVTSNFAVLGLGLSLVLRGAVISFRQRLSAAGVLLAFGGFCGLLWCFFTANSTVGWVIVVYALFSVLYDPSDYFLYVSEQAERYGYDPVGAVTRMLSINSVYEMLIPLLMNFLLVNCNLGMTGGLLGGYVLLMTAGLYITLRRRGADGAATSAAE